MKRIQIVWSTSHAKMRKEYCAGELMHDAFEHARKRYGRIADVELGDRDGLDEPGEDDLYTVLYVAQEDVVVSDLKAELRKWLKKNCP